MSSKADRKQARANHRAAKAALHANQAAEKNAGITTETDTYRELNARVNQTEKSVPWYRR
ncbi:hypothetical protein ACFW81_23715 [Streptomyces angustmyceticus]|uniref:hypothetical protein n=1 Tax=Streptomyces angustmyceticus TaxID=285578 RepID=UPI0036BCC5B5